MISQSPLGAVVLVSILAANASAAAPASAPITFEKDVRPILKAHCFHCHGEDGKTEGGLDVRLARTLTKGGKTGAGLLAGNASGSLFLQRIKKGEMPKGKAHLVDKEILVLEQWINQGARTARLEPLALGPEHAFTDEERGWWSLQPIVKPSVPSVEGLAARQNIRTPIDAFIVARLKSKNLEMSPEAKPETLLRRLHTDIIGLPPSPDEVRAFAAAMAQNEELAVRAKIDELLERPAYGERWGRHWLDVVGYADSDGYSEKDLERKWAWKYRDYVIHSLNTDKPWNDFITEQLAGDEMIKGPLKNLSDADTEKLTGTGFLRMAPDGTGVASNTVSQNACITDTIKIIGTAIYGMTIGCAQCHDHRYDPISQADYYRLRAIFEPGFDTKAWRSPTGRLVSLLTDAERAEAAKVEVEAKKLDAERTKLQEAFIAEVLDKEVAKAPEKDQAALKLAYQTVAAKRSPEQARLLKAYPRVNQLSAGSLYLYDTTYKTQHAKTLEKMAAEAAAVRARKPVEEFVQAFTEVARPSPAAIPATFVFHRGEPDQPKQKVGPGDLSVLAGWRKVELPEKLAEVPGTGRRLAFARTLTDGKHPLLARVLVNRVWMQHFGKGLVASAGDFGKLGSAPSHPELLDWLAADFMENGWSLKRLHRMILGSHVYRQSSARTPERDRIDPDNALLSRTNVRRLEAETLRDALLQTVGVLNGKMGGKPVPVMHNVEGQVVLGIDTTDTAGRPSGKFVSMEGEDRRRSVYVQIRRTMPLEMFSTFDAPSMMDANCDTRPVTTVSPQSLLLMNNGYMREYAGTFAKRVIQEVPSGVEGQVERAIELVFGRGASQAEVQDAVQFVSEQTLHYKNHPAPLEVAVGPVPKTNASPDLLGMAALCHALISSNEFLYID